MDDMATERLISCGYFKSIARSSWTKRVLEWMLPGRRKREREVRGWKESGCSGWIEKSGNWESEDVSAVKKPTQT